MDGPTPANTPICPPNEASLSPMLRPAALAHNISSAVTKQTPLIDTSVPAINAQPVELDGIPTSPQEQELKRRETCGSRVLSPADESIEAEILGQTDKGTGRLDGEVSYWFAASLFTADIGPEARCNAS